MFDSIFSRKRVFLAFAFISIAAIGLDSCVEPFEIEGTIDEFESVLVIEATITNELKRQQVRLTRSFEFEENAAAAESNADVMVLDNQGNTFTFSEAEPGIYISDQAFEAVADRDYSLSVKTSDGGNFASNTQQLTQETPVSISAERLVNEDEVEGMAIKANAFDPSNNSNFYRYEFEETFLIIAPDWVDTDLVTVMPNNPDNCEVELVTRDNNDRICYGTNVSNSILLANTAGLEEDRVSQFLIRFIDRDNFILTHRYSILVRQFVQSPAAHDFFKTLKNLSQSDNLFSQIQPGLLIGNVFSEDDEGEVVLGYFEVASVSEERIFFNYEDFFPGEDLPPYATACGRFAPGLTGEFGGCNLSLSVNSNAVEYLRENLDPTDELPGPYVVVPPACGDCTLLGSNERPSFWVD